MCSSSLSRHQHRCGAHKLRQAHTHAHNFVLLQGQDIQLKNTTIGQTWRLTYNPKHLEVLSQKKNPGKKGSSFRTSLRLMICSFLMPRLCQSISSGPQLTTTRVLAALPIAGHHVQGLCATTQKLLLLERMVE